MKILIFDEQTNNTIEQVVLLLRTLNPIAIILGGSYSTGEQCKLTISDRLYCLSDFDFFVVCNRITQSEIDSVYQQAICLSESLQQHNPYYHIGFKFRTPEEINNEYNTIYYWELINNGINIYNKNYSLPKPTGNICDLLGMPRSKKIQDYLFRCGVARLWCNILFFPIRLITMPTDINFDIWYSYFLCRGALDWITFRLLYSGIHAYQYSERFNLWQNHEGFKDKNISIYTICYDVKIGKRRINYKSIINDIQKLSYEEIKSYMRTATESQVVEVEFLFHMFSSLVKLVLHVDAISSLKYAAYYLNSLTTEPIIKPCCTTTMWCQLRRTYSDYRLNRSLLDKRDHHVNTERFLNLGEGI